MTGKRALLAAFCLAALSPAPGKAQTQFEINREAWQAFAKADAALARTYGRLIAKVSPAGKEALRSAQRTWALFRDQECEFQTMGSREGTVHPMVLAMCKANVTEKRAKQLQSQLDCPEGDVGCGAQ